MRPPETSSLREAALSTLAPAIYAASLVGALVTGKDSLWDLHASSFVRMTRPPAGYAVVVPVLHAALAVVALLLVAGLWERMDFVAHGLAEHLAMGTMSLGAATLCVVGVGFGVAGWDGVSSLVRGRTDR